MPIFCVLRVRIVISVSGGGGTWGCGCTLASDFGVGGGGWSPGLALFAVSFYTIMEESCVSVLDVGVAGVCVCVCGQLPLPGEAGGE